VRRASLIVLACLSALALASTASAASRMWTGFQDDQSFRFAPDRQALLDGARDAGATVIRITVEWHLVAPVRPANPADPFDPAYRLDDVDEVIRNAQARGIEVLLSIWGTPSWANGGKAPNFAPANAALLKNFARALSSRYSGRFAGYPYVRFWSVWNEPNLNQFLAPQFDKKGRSVAPKTYAKLAKAAYEGIKASNASALVAVGETSPRGRDKKSPGGVQDSHSPGKFAELVAKANKRLKFDAWAQHPYSTEVTAPPTQKVKWPNVNLSTLARFETSLDTWFRRKNIPIWVTEYGYQTNPPRPGGVSAAQQSAYMNTAFTQLQKDARVQMFIWFIYRDTPAATGNPWQAAGGVLDSAGAAKLGYFRFQSLARPVDARNAELRLKGGTKSPSVSFSALEIAARSAPGSTVGINYRIFEGATFIGNAIAAAPLGTDGWLGFRPEVTVVKGKTIRLEITATDINGNSVVRTVSLVGT
jgi:aryl-phospho-beta-D-glucosidase BglC (GH1 family)